MAERDGVIAAFLERRGWGKATRMPLAGDASFRRYERLQLSGAAAVLMDAPPDKEDVCPFLAMAHYLTGFGYSAPNVIAAEAENGLVLLEDLGDDLFTRVLESGNNERALYAAAVDLLADLHRRPAPDDLPPYDDERLLAEAVLLTDWYIPALTGTPTAAPVRQTYIDIWRDLFPLARTGAEVMVLRDYHADNLMWLPERGGHARVGLLDFQDAVRGPAAYDLVSLLEDARRDVPPALAEEMVARYLAATGADEKGFRAAYAILGAQRNAKIVGIFTRLWKRDGKAIYLDFIPRVWGLLQRDLAHPALAPIREWFDQAVPSEVRRRRLAGAPA
jgi:aminoglycoside/choline kinase family phosphotransferase